MDPNHTGMSQSRLYNHFQSGQAGTVPNLTKLQLSCQGMRFYLRNKIFNFYAAVANPDDPEESALP